MDLSKLTREARPIVQEAAAVYLKHTRPWFVGFVVHGSAMKGGIIPGCSDIDCQLYLKDSAFTSQMNLPLELCLSIHRDLAKIDPSPFRYIQCIVLSSDLPEDFLGPIPGAYVLIAGKLPVLEATEQHLRAAAGRALDELIPVPPFIIAELVDHGGNRLSHQIRLLCTKIWPMLYHILTLHHADPIRVWGLTKEQAIEILPKNNHLVQTIREFYQAVRSYYPAEESLEKALAVIETGIAFLKAAKSWWNKTRSHILMRSSSALED
ncbi:MAG: hypothetical protein ACFFB3_22105 [Candidatus Hodarchaeota archaeon]